MTSKTWVAGTVIDSAWLNDVDSVAYSRLNTIADLRLLSKTHFTKAIVFGYYNPGDGGGGLYYYDSSDTTSADNGGTIIVGADGGRWKPAPSSSRAIYSVEKFGAIGDGSITTTAMHTALTNAFNSAIGTIPHDLKFSSGTYDCGVNNFPFKNSVNTSLLDCKDLTLWCSTNTILQTTSVSGADVLQLNALKNFHVKGFPTITATVSGTSSGSNGVSVTNGFDNITLQIYAKNLPSLDKTTFVDGGKALTLQNGTTSNTCGILRAEVIADGCAEGFGFEPDLVTSLTKNTQVDVHIQARNGYIGVKHVASAASGALSTSMCSGVRVRGSVVDCQHGVVVQRAHGIDIDVQINSTKTAAAKRLNPSSVAWIASDTVVEGIQSAYAKNSFLRVRGNAGDCDYKARIGGAGAGSSGLNGATEDCEIVLDIGGTSATADVASINSGGNSLKNTRLAVSVITATSWPSDFTDKTNSNRLLLGPNYSGSFTLSLTGCTTVPTVTAKYSVNGDVVVLEIPTGTGTSNSVAATLTGLPTDLQPTTTQGLLGITTDNGVNKVSRINVRNDGVIDLFYGDTSGVFTNVGTKGIQFCTLTYHRS